MTNPRTLKPLALCTLLLLMAFAPGTSLARSSIPTLQILNVDSTNAPDYVVRVSVVSPDGKAIDGLSKDSFSLSDTSGTAPLPVTSVQPINGGVAAMIVADLGGLDRASVYGRRNRNNVEALARRFVDSLKASSDNQHYAGLITIVGVDTARFDKQIAPTSDLGRVENELESIKNVKIAPATALFDGMSQAVEWLTRNPDAQAQAALDQRRKVILVFSDGADNKFSLDTVRSGILSSAKDAGITIFTIHVNPRDANRANLSSMADETNGGYMLYGGTVDETDADAGANAIFESINSQRAQYEIAFNSVKPAGEFTARLTANTPLGSATSEVKYASSLTLPEVVVVEPAANTEYEQGKTKAITLTAQVNFPDNKPRPVSVQFFDGSNAVGDKVTVQPGETAQVQWPLPDEAQSTQIRTVPHTLIASLEDSFLPGKVESKDPVNVTIKVPRQIVSTRVDPLNPLVLASLCGLGVVILGLVGLLFALNKRYRTEMVQIRSQIANRPAGMSVLKAMTQRLGFGQQPIAELKILTGPVSGSLLIYVDPSWIGRDPSQCQVVLNDPAASSKHFQIARLPNTQEFYILDEGSTNGTRVNRQPLVPNTRMALIEGTEIEVGSTRMAFQLGRKTRQLPLTTQQVQGP